MIAHYQAADVFLFPSHQENFGQVVVEAAAAGPRPVGVELLVDGEPAYRVRKPLVLSELPVFREHFAEGAILAPSRGDAARTIARRFSAASSAEVLFALAPRTRTSTPTQRRRAPCSSPPPLSLASAGS